MPEYVVYPPLSVVTSVGSIMVCVIACGSADTPNFISNLPGASLLRTLMSTDTL